MKFVRVMNGNKSHANGFIFEIGKINESSNWNPKADNPKDFGGFNFCTEDNILRWLHRGDTLYDVEVPEDAEIIEVESATTIYRANKIIIKNPRKVTDEIAFEFYKKSKIPAIAYFKAMGALSIMGYDKTAKQILRDKVTKENIDIAIDEWSNFIHREDRENMNETTKFIDEALIEIKSDLLISPTIDKEPYIKDITKDKIINLTGQSGSGKSTYAKEHFNNENYIIIDTDDVLASVDSDRYKKASSINKELNLYLKDKYKKELSLANEFDLIYNEIIAYFIKTDKTVVIDCAQFHCIKNISILKGKIIIMRTSIDNCYQRVLNRYKELNKDNYNEEDFQKYANRKKEIYAWYKGSNEFIKLVDSLKME